MKDKKKKKIMWQLLSELKGMRKSHKVSGMNALCLPGLFYDLVLVSEAGATLVALMVQREAVTAFRLSLKESIRHLLHPPASPLKPISEMYDPYLFCLV